MPKAYTPNDAYFYKAQKMGYRARSAFKLEEILDRFAFLKVKGRRVLDLGSAPGSFLQVLEKRESALLIGVDLQKIEPLLHTKIIQGDIFSEEVDELLRPYAPFDLITSDVAPKTTGQKDIDAYHSVELNERVLAFAKEFLSPQGALVTKIFQGEDSEEFWRDEFKPSFQTTKIFKPKACRDRSKETFFVGWRKKEIPNYE